MENCKVPAHSMASMTKEQTQSAAHNNGPTWMSSDIYGKLAGDVAAATLSATLVTPTVTLIDR